MAFQHKVALTVLPIVGATDDWWRASRWIGHRKRVRQTLSVVCHCSSVRRHKLIKQGKADGDRARRGSGDGKLCEV